jgi:acetoin utilization deacetylase AcuC-like enzyme
MPVTVYHNPAIFLHDEAANHVAMTPDRIARIFDVVSQVKGANFKFARRATDDEFHRVHPAEYVEAVKATRALPPGEFLEFNQETRLNHFSYEAMAYSAGAVCEAVEAAVQDPTHHGFCLGYPGHHAYADKPSGFCFTNQIVVGLRHAQSLGVGRIAILDFDTHSGNGTALNVLNDKEVLFVETYQRGYPGAYLPEPCPAHIQRILCERTVDWVPAWVQLLAKVRAFNPELVLVSAGFDAHEHDPLGHLGVVDESYAWIASEIAALGSPVVAALEGGYSVPDTARCTAQMVRILGSSGTL